MHCQLNWKLFYFFPLQNLQGAYTCSGKVVISKHYWYFIFFITGVVENPRIHVQLFIVYILVENMLFMYMYGPPQKTTKKPNPLSYRP